STLRLSPFALFKRQGRGIGRLPIRAGFSRRILSRYTFCSSGNVLSKDPQFAFGNLESREAALQADFNLRERPDNGHVQTLEAREMHSNFATECACVGGLTRFTRHWSLPCPDGNDVIELGCLRVGKFSTGGNRSSER